MSELGERWVRFLRQYGPISQNENMYDEHIMRAARRLGVRPIDFPHPIESDLLALLSPESAQATSIVLIGNTRDHSLARSDCGHSDKCG